MKAKASLAVNCWMDFPKDGDNRVIQGILRRMNPNYRLIEKAMPLSCPIFWEEESFALGQVSLFRRAPLEKQKEILRNCSLMLLKEAFAIERAGMAFASKMALLADDLDTRLLYCQFAAQEAGHYQMIAAHIQGEPRALEQDPFLMLLKEAIEMGDRMTLTLVIQVVLEGWGLLHYRKLQRECLCEDLSQQLKQILADEAHHHGSGVALFDEAAILEPDYCLNVLQRLLAMVRVGPVGVLQQIVKILGPLDERQQARIFEEMRHPEQTSFKLQQIRSVMNAGGAQTMIERLGDFFSPLNFEAWEYRHA